MQSLAEIKRRGKIIRKGGAKKGVAIGRGSYRWLK